MATSKPFVTPVITPLYMRQLELTILLNLYRALHGGDFFNGDALGTEASGLGFVSYLDQQKIGTADNIVENLAKMGFKLEVTIGDKTTEVKTTEQYRDLSIDQPGPLPVRHCIISMETGVKFCWPIVFQVKENTQPSGGNDFTQP